ncbi:metallophosphoesterase [Rapidithrix thailandica]|uniref:Metallophosphoesterase n=1 Tax=Rapidithrix thailandica TaxID=413964 RepID=A0AAW9SEU8_9BACT
MKHLYLILCFLLCIPLTGIAQKKPFYHPEVSHWKDAKPSSQEQITYSLFLVGDAGTPLSESKVEPGLDLLRQQLQTTQVAADIIFLGDNIYPKGLHSKEHPLRKQDEQNLTTQLELLRDFKGKGYFIPGNHDWAQGKAYGLENRLNQEAFITEYGLDNALMLPEDACPGPKVIPVNDELILILIDTQWWLHPFDKPGIESDCDVKNEEEFLLLLKDVILENYDKQIVVAGHHPLYSNGLHGGHAPLKYHLFPLTSIKKGLFVPLPGLGSIYVMARTVVGNIQDVPHPLYQALVEKLEEVFQLHPNLIYAAGHEHSLQYIPKNKLHYVISGAGCKASYVGKNKQAHFTYRHKGFAKVNFYTNGDVWLEFWVAGEDEPQGKVAYREKLFTHTGHTAESQEDTTAFRKKPGEMVSVAASQKFASNEFNTWFLGENYRSEWSEKLKEVPCFDPHTMLGGLKVVKRGGGNQTKSLRLRAPDAKEYVLRSVEKFPEKVLPSFLRKTIAEDIVEEQITSSHPFAALTIPRLSEAYGIYHTNPTIFYVPRSSWLGRYASDFSEGLYLFEERPDDNWEKATFFGNSKKIISTAKVLKKIRKDNDDLIDQSMVLKSRLFDSWIGDWDRHDDQWRWASFKDSLRNIKVYQPIPRDRDQAFFWSDGFLMKLGTRKWGLRNFQGFHHEIRDPVGLNYYNVHFDRSFLNQPEWPAWQAAVDSLQSSMKDELIEEAIRDLPQEIYQYSGEEIIAKLKSRRDNFEQYAREWYLYLAKEVDIVGSKKHEYFQVERLNEEETRVRVFKMKKDSREKKHLIYERTFLRSETKEIRLYGMEGEDFFEIKGDVKKGIRVRVIGGEDKDEVNDVSSVKGWRKKTKVYDQPGGIEIKPNKETQNKTASDPQINQYDRKAYKINYVGPLLTMGISPDDGIVLGGGVQMKTYGFRKEPFKAHHRVLGSVAPKNLSFSVHYQGEFRHILGKWDAKIIADVRYPNFVDFFYGLGNETENHVNERGKNYYRLRYKQVKLFPALRRKSTDGQHEYGLSYYFQNIEIEDDTDKSRFIFSEESGLKDATVIEEDQRFQGFFGYYQLDLRNSEVFPTSGLYMNTTLGRIWGFGESQIRDINYTKLITDWRFYWSPGRAKRLTFALRAGGAVNWGDYQFFQANTLGGAKNLRGFRRMRFAGDKSFYSNNEVRFTLLNVRTFLFPAQLGLSGLYDVGRVWYEDDQGKDPSVADGTSEKWHQGIGGGVWISPFNKAIISLDLTHSEEEDRFLAYLRLGFMF